VNGTISAQNSRPDRTHSSQIFKKKQSHKQIQKFKKNLKYFITTTHIKIFKFPNSNKPNHFHKHTTKNILKIFKQQKTITSSIKNNSHSKFQKSNSKQISKQNQTTFSPKLIKNQNSNQKTKIHIHQIISKNKQIKQNWEGSEINGERAFYRLTQRPSDCAAHKTLIML